jgi:hypothetical protein
MTKLSTGDDSTLGTYKKLASAIFGENSKAVEFLNEKIKSDPDGENGEVIADEGQMINLLLNLASND